MIHVCSFFIMTFCGSMASIFLKKASDSLEIKKIFLNIPMYLGGGLYLLASFLNIYLLRIFEYSMVLPITSLTYVWTMVLSRIVFKERITARKVLGVLFILVGAFFVAAT